MKRMLYLIFFFLVFFGTIYADQTKEIKKSFKINSGQKIEFENFSGLKIRVIPWEKNEVGFNLKATVKCSDNEYEKIYARSLDIVSDSTVSKQILKFVKTKEEAGFFFLGLFKVRLFYHFSAEIIGEVYLPQNSGIQFKIRYSDIYLNGIKGIEEIKGNGNDLIFENCAEIRQITNPYGKMKFNNCEGDINIYSKSSSIQFYNHSGNIFIDSDYSDIKIRDVDGVVEIENKSGEIEVGNAAIKKLDVSYSKIDLRDISNKEDYEISLRGNSIKGYFQNVNANLDIESSYSKLQIVDMAGKFQCYGNNLKIRGKKISGDIIINSSYSNIEIDEITSREIKIRKSYNSIDLKLISNPELVEIKNEYNKTVLTLPGNYDGEIRLKAKYAAIKSNFNLEINENLDHRYAIFRGKDSKRSVMIENISGDIILSREKL